MTECHSASWRVLITEKMEFVGKALKLLYPSNHDSSGGRGYAAADQRNRTFDYS